MINNHEKKEKKYIRYEDPTKDKNEKIVDNTTEESKIELTDQE